MIPEDQATIFVKTLGNSSQARVMDYLITSRGLPIHQSDVIKNSKVSKATIIKIWSKFIEQKLILYNRTIGRAKLYTLNTKDLRIQKLIELYNICLEKEAELGLKEAIEIPT
tara:strand:- start:9 stop:344 length:336 start_codon:yes stop_codon:yes gene_type:complete